MSSNTYTWVVESIDCYPQAEGQTDVAFTIHWRCNATSTETHTVNGQTVPYTATIYSTCPVTYTAGSPFTPYSQLTKDQVLGWIWGSGVNQDATQASLDTMIANIINPPVISPALPFTN